MDINYYKTQLDEKIELIKQMQLEKEQTIRQKDNYISSLQNQMSKLTEEYNFFKKLNTEKSENINQLQTQIRSILGLNSNFFKKRVNNYYDLDYKGAVRTELRKQLLSATEFIHERGLKIKLIEIVPIEWENVNFEMIIRKKDYQEKKKPSTNVVLYYKDKFCVPDALYSMFRTKCGYDGPALSKIKNLKIDLDKLFIIQNNEMGVFVSFKTKLAFRLQKYFERKYGGEQIVNNDEELYKKGLVFRDQIIHIKLSADGTNIGRNLKLLNFIFCVMNEGAVAKRATGNYTLGVFEIENEQHSSLTDSFKELIDEIENLTEIEVFGRKLKIVYYYGADWKMLAIILGLQGAHSKYPCCWCKCGKEDFHRTDLEWSIVDVNKGARSHEERTAILAYENQKELVTFGQVRPAIFRNIIPTNRYMIDMLHLFLRISDTLLNMLVKDCTLADNFDASAISQFELKKYKHMNSLQHFMNEKCNVRFQFFWVAETRKLTWRDLMGPDKKKIFENFNLKEIIPGHEKFNEVSQIWNDFYELLEAVKQVDIDAAELKIRTIEWLELYLTVYSKNTVTPYMHAFVSHLPEFVHLYKDINAFNCQGLEKLNDISSQQFFRGTNKQDTTLHQILKKRNRIEYLYFFTDEYLKSIEDKEVDEEEVDIIVAEAEMDIDDN